VLLQLLVPVAALAHQQQGWLAVGCLQDRLLLLLLLLVLAERQLLLVLMLCRLSSLLSLRQCMQRAKCSCKGSQQQQLLQLLRSCSRWQPLASSSSSSSRRPALLTAAARVCLLWLRWEQQGSLMVQLQGTQAALQLAVFQVQTWARLQHLAALGVIGCCLRSCCSGVKGRRGRRKLQTVNRMTCLVKWPGTAQSRISGRAQQLARVCSDATAMALQAL
jgi:hypothetical protein